MSESRVPATSAARVTRFLAGLLLVLGALTSMPLPAATAASAPSGVRATASTPTTVSLAWKAVARAPKYRVQYAKTSTMSDPTYRRTTEARLQLTGLEPGVTYYVRVRVITTGGRSLSPYSGPVKVRTTAATPSGLKTTAATPTTASLTWKPVPEAPLYRIQYATTSSMADARYRRSPEPRLELTRLESSAVYWVRVRVITAEGAVLSPYSAPVPVRTTTPAPTGLRASVSDATTVALTWEPVERAPQYAVEYATDEAMSGAVERRVSDSRADLTGLRADTTYYFRVRVLASNGTPLSPYSARTMAVTTTGAPLRVASYNVRCANCFDGLPEERRWEDRRDAVVASIRAQDLDVLGVQEASQGKLKDASGSPIDLSQFEDLQRRLGGPWKLTNDKRYNCVRSTTPSRCVYQDQGASRSTRILYDSSRIELLSSGSKRLGTMPDGSSERYLAWAVLRQRGTGQRFLFANSHLEDDDIEYELRKAEAEVAVRTIAEVNTDHLPVIAVGDWNSHRFDAPTNAPYDVYRAAGFVDPLGTAYKTRSAVNPTAETRTNAWLNSFNGFLRQANGHRAWGTGTYIDYMLTTPMRVSEWETVAHLDANDRFLGVIPSDHNMVRMTVHLPR